MPTNQVSIDRITVSGEIKAEYRELQRVMNALGSSWELSGGVFRLIREYLTAILKILPITLRMRFKLVLGVWTLTRIN